ncbi:hypothetical protein OF846_003873 [Rhodotorula toruloides]|nr:hypothetical protein OF846_003873 [Rhodotorula toruloides]
MPYSEPYTDTSRLRPPTRRPCVQLGVPLYPDHFLFLVQLLLEIDYPIWYGEFEELYCQVSVLERAAEDVFDTIGSKVYSPPEALTALQGDPAQLWKYRNFAMPAFLRRRFIHTKYDGPVLDAWTYENTQVQAPSIEDEEPLRLDNGVVIDLRRQFREYDAASDPVRQLQRALVPSAGLLFRHSSSPAVQPGQA